MNFQVSVGVAVFIVYHVTVFCRPGTENIYYLLMQNQIRIQPKIVSLLVSLRPSDSDLEKLSDSTTCKFEFKLGHIHNLLFI